jgi:hypothetical protein
MIQRQSRRLNWREACSKVVGGSIGRKHAAVEVGSTAVAPDGESVEAGLGAARHLSRAYWIVTHPALATSGAGGTTKSNHIV